MRLAGYAALIDIRDRGGDVIRSGAFAGLQLPLPLLWQHDSARRIGTITQARETARGLWVEGVIDHAGATARRVMALLRAGTLSGLSFGYSLRDFVQGPPALPGCGTRDLLRVTLHEISLVTHPMQPGARVVTCDTA